MNVVMVISKILVLLHPYWLISRRRQFIIFQRLLGDWELIGSAYYKMIAYSETKDSAKLLGPTLINSN